MTSREDGVEDAVDEVGPGRSGYRGNNEMSFPRILVHSCFLGMAALVCGGTLLIAEEVQFHRDVEPIFAAQCLKCHGPDRQRSGLRLDLRGSLLRGGDYGQPSIVPGRPQNSLLMAAVSDPDSDLRMPPEGPGLTKTQIDTLRRWIAGGADWPGQMDETGEMVIDHWAFMPIVSHAEMPATGDNGETPAGSDAIDRLVNRQLNDSGLSMSGPADAITLLRRVSFVLTGLPPTPNDVARLLADPDGVDAGYRRAVDRLLDSPRYGERWAQHWLDVIRWAETVGFETNQERQHAWPYRDWVIKSFNDDKPYDQFVFEQLAGDTCGEDVALGFLVAGPANLPGQIGRDEEAMRQARQDELDEVIRTVSQSLFGLTIGCARCHNHKFDPILQRDYYAMQAVFAGLSYGHRRWRGETNDQWAAQIPAAQKRVDKAVARLEDLQRKHQLESPTAAVQTDVFDPVVVDAVRMEIASTENGAAASLYELRLLTAADDRETEVQNVALASAGSVASASSFALANQTRHHDNLVDGSVDRRQAFPWVAEKAGPAWVQVDLPKPARVDRVVWDRGSSSPAEYVIKVRDPETGQWRKVADPLDRLPALTDRRDPLQVKVRDLSSDEIKALFSVLAEVRSAKADLTRLRAGPQVYAAKFTQPADPTWLLRRGDPMQRGDEVAPGVPQFLGDLHLAIDEPEANRRVRLAEHLLNPKHPLTARVMVNRVWQHHFGSGLVDTPSDFGKMGSKPTHAALLDRLASEFVADDWSLKKLHRRIALSQTFRQSSRPRAEALEVDADSRLLWRFPPRRLEAEAIRDSIIFVSGKLDDTMGGRGFNLFKQRGGLSDYTPLETFDPSGWRRMIYAHKIRMQQVDVFGAFDCPDAGQMKPKRTQSITPTQSLGLLNSPMVIRQAGFFADRITDRAGADLGDQVDQAFQLSLSRRPTESEHHAMMELVRSHGLQQLCRVLFNTSEFLYIQ